MQRAALVMAALVTLASQASAADLGAPAYDQMSAWSWTGCYFGAHAGGLWGDSDKWIPRTPGGAFEGVSLGGHGMDGFIGGVQGGCDYQTASGVVIGVAGNYGWTHADGTHASARETGVFYHSDVEALASINGRLGYAFDRVLLYVDGGTAWERVDYRASTTMIGRHTAQATTGPAGPSAEAANTPSATGSRPSSNSAIMISAPSGSG